MHLFASTCDFPVLKRLALICGDQLDWPAGDVVHFFSALPALEELYLDMRFPFSHLELPWARLRRCTLARCDEDMILRILPLPAPDAHFSSMVFGPARISIGNVQSPIGALALDSYYREPVTVFCSLTAPSLKELAITTYIESPSQLASPLLSFLGRSACTLTSLYLHTSLAEHDLLTILESPHAHSIVSLDIGYPKIAPISSVFIDALTTRGLVPNLEVLVLAAFPITVHEETSLLALVASRRAMLRSLRIRLYGTPNSVVPQATAQALRAEGIDFIVGPDSDQTPWWHLA
jgi:hypothetical protein